METFSEHINSVMTTRGKRGISGVHVFLDVRPMPRPLGLEWQGRCSNEQTDTTRPRNRQTRL
jgi:hypothetical protein